MREREEWESRSADKVFVLEREVLVVERFFYFIFVIYFNVYYNVFLYQILYIYKFYYVKFKEKINKKGKKIFYFLLF